MKKMGRSSYSWRMMMTTNIALTLALLLSISSWAPMAESSKNPAASARKEDIPFIKCQVCEKLASELHSQVKKKEAQISPKKISEYQIIEIVENACNLKKEEADWILKIDIVEKGDRLELVDQDVEGQCNAECKTIERACQEVLGYSDTDLAEYIYARKPQLDALSKYLCKDLTNACSKKPPPVPKDRVPGEPFEPKPTKEAEMEKIMRSMEGLPGAPGMKMYSRDQLMNMQNLGDEDGDEDDDDEEFKLPANLGKILKEKKTEEKKADWKDKVVKQVTSVGKTLKTHADKVSYKLRRWWRSKTNANSKKQSGSKKTEL